MELEEVLARYSSDRLRRGELTRAGKKDHLRDNCRVVGEEAEKILLDLYGPEPEPTPPASSSSATPGPPKPVYKLCHERLTYDLSRHTNPNPPRPGIIERIENNPDSVQGPEAADLPGAHEAGVAQLTEVCSFPDCMCIKYCAVKVGVRVPERPQNPDGSIKWGARMEDEAPVEKSS